MWRGDNYFFNKDVIITIRDLPLTGVSYAIVFSCPKKDSFYAVRGNTKEIIKFKSLLKAKDLGWNIKNIHIGDN
mgnify:CR=1 FL=1